ncbi:hypothetical protein I2F27_11205 [Acinetobacter sp. B5B]|uniref:hypothetical protein n=1 Tax=Acinetobacter baretiae TaxID=2605383 RepID=UPI0018C2938D|nr:hypothetical protein [Acinetobacter baretiae]MBF7683886.1 hypothetical protein [Acinetobacter baretiae]
MKQRPFKSQTSARPKNDFGVLQGIFFSIFTVLFFYIIIDCGLKDVERQDAVALKQLHTEELIVDDSHKKRGDFL